MISCFTRNTVWYILAQCFECLSYYGTRSVLILFLSLNLGLSDSNAFKLYVSVVILADAFSSIGGKLGDIVSGRHFAVFAGSVLIFCSVSLLSVARMDQTLIYFAMALLSIGVCLFRPNCMTIICDSIRKDIRSLNLDSGLGDNKEGVGVESGMTITYALMDFGFFLGYCVGGILMKYYGFTHVFLFLSLGAFLSTTSLLMVSGSKYNNDNNGRSPFQNMLIFVTSIVLCIFSCFVLISNNWIINYLIILPSVVTFILFFRMFIGRNSFEKIKLAGLLTYSLLFLFFVALERQNSLSITLFVQRNVDRHLFGFEVPTVTLFSIMSVTIMIAGPIASYFIKRFFTNSIFPSYRFIFGFLMILLSFFVLYLGCHFANSEGVVSVCFPIISLIFCGIADSVIVPSVFSMCNRLSDENSKGFIVGMSIMILAFGHILSNKIAQSMAIAGAEFGALDLTSSLKIYKNGFSNVLIICVVFVLFSIICKFLFDKAVDSNISNS